VSNLIRLDRRSDGESHSSTSIFALRMISALDPDEFADAVARELGWPVPLLVYLEWERGEDSVPPPQVLHAAREAARRHPIGSMAMVNRRRFLGGVVALSALAAAGGPLGAKSGMGALRALPEGP
jgi:hypothetical protein